MKKILIVTFFFLFVLTLNSQSLMGVDSTFGDNGHLFIGPGSFEGHNALLQPDGKMIFYGDDIGMSSQSFDKDLRMVRVNIDGSLDTTFNQTGIVYEHQAFGRYFVGSIAKLLPSGKIIVAGGGTNIGSNLSMLSVGCYKPDGSIDSVFGINGWVNHAFDSLRVKIRDFKLTVDSKILILANANSVSPIGSTSKYYLCQLNENGQFDTSFGINGIHEISDTMFLYLRSLEVASTGAIYVLGDRYDDPLQTQPVIFAFNPDGSPDTIVNIDLVPFAQNSIDPVVNTMAIQPDDKLLLGAILTPDMALVRLNTDLTFDKSFNRDGVAQGDNTDPFQAFSRIYNLENGKLLTSLGRFSMGMYNKNGSIDYSFNLTGLYTGPPPSGWTGEGSNTGTFALLPLPDGKIIQASFVNNRLYLTRYEQKSCVP